MTFKQLIEQLRFDCIEYHWRPYYAVSIEQVRNGEYDAQLIHCWHFFFNNNDYLDSVCECCGNKYNRKSLYRFLCYACRTKVEYDAGDRADRWRKTRIFDEKGGSS